jgi:hypothetical protein
LEQQPAKRDGDQRRDEKGEPDPSLVVAADGSKLRAVRSSVDCDIRYLLPGAVLPKADGDKRTCSNLTISYQK